MIVLTPYDLLRLKSGPGLSSSEFVDKYTLVIPKKNRLIPLVVLKMNEDKIIIGSLKKRNGPFQNGWPMRG